MQNELRDHEYAVEKAGIGDVGNTSVNDDAGVENLLVGAVFGLASKKSAQRGKIQQFALRSPCHRTHVGKQQQADDLHEVKRVRGFNACAPYDQADQRRAQHSRNHAEYHADQALEADARDAAFQYDRQHAQRRSDECCGPERLVHGAKVSGTDAENQNEYSPENNKIQHALRPLSARL